MIPLNQLALPLLLLLSHKILFADKLLVVQLDDNLSHNLRACLSKEETGFTEGQWFHTGSTYANPANQNNSVQLFLAIDVQQSQVMNADDNEEIEVIHEGFVEFLRQIWNGTVQLQGLHVAAIHFSVHFILISQQPSLTTLRQCLRNELFRN